jgi:hypothetical protein
MNQVRAMDSRSHRWCVDIRADRNLDIEGNPLAIWNIDGNLGSENAVFEDGCDAFAHMRILFRG